MRLIALVGISLLGLVACADGEAPRQPTAQQPQQQQPQQTAPLRVASANFVSMGCRAFIERSTAEPYAQGMCAGKVMAVAGLATGICYPSEVTVGQMIRVVARYIDERPARLHENFLILAREALRQAWPCRR